MCEVQGKGGKGVYYYYLHTLPLLCIYQRSESAYHEATRRAVSARAWVGCSYKMPHVHRKFNATSARSAMGDAEENTTAAAEKPTEAADTSETEEKTEDNLREKYTLWGLGRGVDITKQTPWLTKTPFQVRAVRPKDLIETDEGRLLKAYSEEVNSSTTIHYQVRAGIKAPDVPLTIGVDSEYSRTDCSNKHVVGLKVKNRTISFRVDFADIAKSRVTSAEKAREQMRKNKTKCEYKEPGADIEPPKKTEDEHTPEDVPFESRLCEWLCECLENRGIKAKGTLPHELMFLLIERKGGNEETDGEDEGNRLIDNDEEIGELQKDISHFIRQLGVTHYVSAIELGGLSFRVLTEKEYERKISLSGSASLNSKLYGGIQATTSKSNLWKFKSKREERKMIGKITPAGKDGAREVVEKGDEAVIGCHIRPISSLVRNPYLHKAINESVKIYTQETISGKSTCNSMQCSLSEIIAYGNST